VGENALSETVTSTGRWDAADYAKVGAFVSELGQAALDLLDPKPGERILDVGCGTGSLTLKIAQRGATVTGIDSSLEMVDAAHENGVDALVVDAADMHFDSEFDAAFSNAALHWMLDRDAVAAGIFRALKPGGRCAGEMGGSGNISTLRRGIRAELEERGYPVPADDPQWYPTVEEFADVYGRAGFTGIDAQLIERPTPLAHGVAAWVKTFRAGWLDAAKVPDDKRDEVADAIERRLEPKLRDDNGNWTADYVRLRFIMRKT
jgi:trans-aconitate methyltransferase